jgi:hypothetical protein
MSRVSGRPADHPDLNTYSVNGAWLVVGNRARGFYLRTRRATHPRPNETYKWACDRKALPAVNRAGKQLNFPRRVTDWDDQQVASAYAILSEPVVNGKAPR